jgi:hypothetical protein
MLSALKNLFIALQEKKTPFDILNFLISIFNNNYISFLMFRASSSELTRSFGWDYPTQQDLPDFSREFKNYLNIIAKVNNILFYLNF